MAIAGQATTVNVAGSDAARSGVLRSSTAHLLVALVLLIFISPFLPQSQAGMFFNAFLTSLVLVAGAMAIGYRRSVLMWAVILAVPAVTSIWLYRMLPGLMPSEILLGAALLFIALLVVNLARFVVMAPRINADILCAAAANYVLLALFWAFAYELLDKVNPASFQFTVGPVAAQSLNGFAGIYFSLSTQCTVGYGDIVPVTNVARMLAVVQATTGMFYVTMLIARLVALYSSHHQPGEP
jgi:hypothetical protein